jgi:hypothetical protein
MSKPFTDLDLTVWRLVRDAEGYSSTRQVVGQLPGAYSSRLVGGALERLKNAGHLRQRPHYSGARYAVTTSCTAPDGESLQPCVKPTAPPEPLAGTAPTPTATADGALPLTPEQMSQQVDLSLRLMQMALRGAPSPSEGVDLTLNELALHGLMTAYASLASADQALTYRAACALLTVSQDLARQHENRVYHYFGSMKRAH